MTVFRLQIINEIKILLILMFTMLIVLQFGSCKDTSTGVNEDNPEQETPRTSVPTQLAGDWYTGNISSVNFFNATTGQWGSPSGTGIFFKFSADGYYEKGVLLQSSLYGCTSSFLAYNKGTMTIEDNVMVLYPTYGKIKSTDNCVAENNYEKSDQLQQEVIIWELGMDEYGSEVLYLRYEEGSPSAFYRQ